MSNYLEMRHGTGSEHGYSISSELPGVGTGTYTNMWFRVRFAMEPGFQHARFNQTVLFTPIFELPLENANGSPNSPQSVGAMCGLTTGSGGEYKPFVQVYSAASGPLTGSLSPAFENHPGSIFIKHRTVYLSSSILDTGTPMDFVMNVGREGNTLVGRVYLGPANGTLYNYINEVVYSNAHTFSGSLDAVSANMFSYSHRLFVGNNKWHRLFLWETIDGTAHPDPYGLVSGSPIAFSNSLTGLQIIGDDFSGYSNKTQFQLSVNNSTTTNASDTYPNPPYTNTNYSSSDYWGYGYGFYDTGLVTGDGTSYWTFNSTAGRYMHWRFVSSSTNSPSTDAPFGGTAIWQLCTSIGNPMSPAKLVAYMSGNWNVSGVLGHPSIGMFDYTSSLNTDDWKSNIAGGAMQYWATYPGTATPLTTVSMSLRNLVNATFNVPIPSGSYGASAAYNNYGFYPILPINASSSIFDI